VPVHGQVDTTKKFLASFARQTVKCQLTFVDDRSPDNTVQWLKENGWQVEVPKRRLWYNGILNMAIQSATTELIGILNNDLILGKHFIEATIQSFEQTDYDILVPFTLPTPDHSQLDRQLDLKVVPLYRREGWCILGRSTSLKKLPPIPSDDLRLWYGDTWLFHHAWRAGMKIGLMLHNRIYHEVSKTIQATQKEKNINPVIMTDMKVFKEKYSWLSKHKPLGLYKIFPPFIRSLLLPHYRIKGGSHKKVGTPIT